MPLVLSLILAAIPALQAQEKSAEEFFFEGNIHFAEEAFAEAIPLYEAAIQEDPSPNLHYNLGNAYYHLGDWGRARIHWERALAMEPRHTAAAQNLQALLQQLDLPKSGPGFWEGAAGIFSFNQWVWIGALSFWLMVFSLLARQWKKREWVALPLGCGALGVVLATASFLLLNPTRNLAIVLGAETSLRVAPTPGSPVAAPLRPAQRIRVADTYGSFYRVLLESGEEGYVQSEQVEKIR